ncbi:MAG: triose-phosphate isomerase [Anaerolineae bacterium]
MRIPLMAGNWKMYKGPGQAIVFFNELSEAVADVEDREVLICPPFVDLYALGRMLRKSETRIKLGAQNLYPAEEGAYTGEISPPMLRECNCDYVIVGHSERRQYFDEDDTFINQKVKAARQFALIPILCVGETEAQRDAGQAEDVVATQVREGLAGVEVEEAGELVIAYEPVWAIGTGRTATPEDAQAMHAHIRIILMGRYGEKLAGGIRILYGGSVKPANVDDLMAQPDIDGALVGGASLEVESFARIVKFQA